MYESIIARTEFILGSSSEHYTDALPDGYG